MRTITLATRRPFSWKAYVALLALLGLASVATIPEAMAALRRVREESSILVPPWLACAIVALTFLLLGASLGGIGLLLAGRIGLGLPFIEGWCKREAIWGKLRGMLVLSVVIGVVASLLGVALDELVFDPLLESESNRLRITLSAGVLRPGPAWLWPTMIFAGPIWEEVVCRLFGLTLLAWLMGQVSHNDAGRPTPAVFWIANALVAAVFGLVHLPPGALTGAPLSLIVIRITQAMACPGLGGLALGWLYWKQGLESAMLAHSSANIAVMLVGPLLP